jgi:UDP-N-acetylglucosamine--N-acetylmuramyl-(pentapeptide) pyrophosphoryl-undecaprenol N-acetylglucosamine transferase
LAVAEQLMLRGCDVLALVSPKEVDQQAVKTLIGIQVATLPAVGMTRGKLASFVTGCWKSYRASRRGFRDRPPQAVLAMGGFTSFAPVLAGKACGAATFLHESNTIPGKANRWLAHFVDQAFVGFAEAAGRLHHHNILCTGTPVRPQFQPAEAAACRVALGLAPERPLLLIMGGSQGASGINERMLDALPGLVRSLPQLQFLHLTGLNEVDKVRAGYDAVQVKAVVRPFLSEMELALGAADVAISRAGASSMAELAAMRLPAILIPYPAATDNHQLHNARTYVEAGAAVLFDQKHSDAEAFSGALVKLFSDAAVRERMRRALDGFHHGGAAQLIAERMLALLSARSGREPLRSAPPDATGTPLHHCRQIQPSR